jgi:neutrophil factor 2
MSLKAELEIWQAALQAAPTDIPRAIALFDKIGDTSKIEWNIGILLATQGRHCDATERFTRAIELDDWLVVAWFQAGISRFVSPMLGRG